MASVGRWTPEETSANDSRPLQIACSGPQRRCACSVAHQALAERWPSIARAPVRRRSPPRLGVGAPGPGR
eukprot:15450829-Alexandrium_andersonii.AAC.1